jgi:hypothetical protein
MIDDDELDHELTLVRIAENQSAFRAANERIETGAERAAIFGPFRSSVSARCGGAQRSYA